MIDNPRVTSIFLSNFFSMSKLFMRFLFFLLFIWFIDFSILLFGIWNFLLILIKSIDEFFNWFIKLRFMKYTISIYLIGIYCLNWLDGDYLFLFRIFSSSFLFLLKFDYDFINSLTTQWIMGIKLIQNSSYTVVL